MHVSNPRIALAAAVAAAFALSGAARADAAVTHTVQDRTLTVTGDAAANLITLRFPAADPTSLELDLGDDGSADARIPRAQFDRIRVLAGDGDDRVRVDDGGPRAPAVTPVSMDGQGGNDTLLGGRGADELTGGDGNDAAEGGAGADQIALGAGNDSATWDPGDGLDKFDGGAGFDSLAVNGSDAPEQLRALADGTRARMMRDGASIAYATTLERIDVAARGGDDEITIGDLTGTAVQEVRENGGAGADALTLIGTAERRLRRRARHRRLELRARPARVHHDRRRRRGRPGHDRRPRGRRPHQRPQHRGPVRLHGDRRRRRRQPHRHPRRRHAARRRRRRLRRLAQGRRHDPAGRRRRHPLRPRRRRPRPRRRRGRPRRDHATAARPPARRSRSPAPAPASTWTAPRTRSTAARWRRSASSPSAAPTR